MGRRRGHPRVNLRIDLERFIEAAGTQTFGRSSEIAKLCGVTKQAVSLWMRTSYIPHRALPILANHFKWSPKLIKEICDPQTEEPVMKKRTRKKVNPYGPLAKLNPTKVKRLRAMRENGAHAEALAKKFDITKIQVYRIINRVQWVNV